MKKIVVFLSVLTLSWLFVGCGGGSQSTQDAGKVSLRGYFIEVEGAEYNTSSGLTGVTSESGEYLYRKGDMVTFFANGAKLGTIDTKEKVSPFSFSKPQMVSQVLQSMDEDGVVSNGIQIVPLKNGTRSVATARSLNRREDKPSYILDIEKVSIYDKKYKEFLDRRGVRPVSVTEAVVKNAIAQMKKPPAIKKSTFIDRVMGGDYKIPIRKYANSTRVQRLFGEKKYWYRLNLAALHTMYLEMVFAQNNLSNRILNDAERYSREVDAASRLITSSVSYAMDTATFENIDDDLKKYLAKTSNNYNFMVDNFAGEEYGPAAKMAGTVLFDCVGKYATDDSMKDCALNVAEYGINSLIESTLSDKYPVWTASLKNLTGVLKDVANTAIECSEKLVSEDCIKASVNAVLGQSVKVAGESLKIYRLAKDVKNANSKALGMEIFFAAQYLNFNPYNERCDLAEYYGGSKTDCEGFQDTVLSGSSDKELKYLIDKIIDSNEVLEFVSGIVGPDYDIEVVKQTIDTLSERYYIVRKIYMDKLKKYRGDDGKVKESLVDLRITKDVVLSFPDLSVNFDKDTGKADLESCFYIYTSRAIESVSADLSIGGPTETSSFELYEYPSAFMGSRKVCGKLTDYSFSENSSNEEPLFISGKVRFKFMNTDFNKEFEVNTHSVYQYIFSHVEPIAGLEPSLNIEYSFDDQKRSYKLNASLVVGADREEEEVEYHWSVDGGIGCGASSVTMESRYDFAVPKECEKRNFIASLRVFDSKGILISEKSVALDPVTAQESLSLAVVAEPSNVNVDVASPATIDFDVRGGTPPYTIRLQQMSDNFDVKIVGNRVTIEAKGAVRSLVSDNIPFSVQDSSGDRVDGIEISVSQNATPEEMATLGYIKRYKTPYSELGVPAVVKPDESFVQSWGIQNSSGRTLKSVTFRLNRSVCDTRLVHGMDDFVLGDIRPDEIKKVSLDISTEGVESGDVSYCQWDAYYTDDSGETARLYWNIGRKPARINYHIRTERRKDPYPPLIDNVKLHYENGVVTGGLTVKQYYNRVKNLRVALSSKPYFPKNSTFFVDIGSGYDEVQPAGQKSFEYSIGGWPTDTLFWRVEAKNADGVVMQKDVWGGIKLKGYEPPAVYDVKPKIAQLNMRTVFTVQGKNLPDTLSMSLAGAECDTVIVTSEKASVTCTPRSTGMKRFYVAVTKGGEGVGGQEQLYVNVVQNIEDAIRYDDGTMTITDAEGGFKISWSAASGKGVHYNLYRSMLPGTLGDKVYIGSGLSFTDGGLQSGAHYYYTVEACNEYGCVKGPAADAIYSPGQLPNAGPSITLLSAPSSIYVDEPFELKIEVSAKDGDINGFAAVWGDGTASSGSVDEKSEKFELSLSHEYNTTGSYAWKIQVIDVNGNKSNIIAGTMVVKGVNAPQTSKEVIDALGSEIFYGVEKRSDPVSTVLVRYRFNADVTRLDTEDLEGANYSFTKKLRVDGNIVIVSPDSNDTAYFRITEVRDDYIVVEDIDVAGDVIYNINGSKKLYRNLEDAKIEYGNLRTDLRELIVGKIFYYHCKEGGADLINTITFGADGNLAVEHGDGTVEKSEYRIDGLTLIISDDYGEWRIVLKSRDEDSITFSDPYGETSTIYTSKSKALAAPAEECGEEDVGGTLVSGLISGHVDFYDADGNRAPVPSDAWIRVTPKDFQVEGQWWGINCAIDSSGNFGSECYIDIAENAMRAKFDDSSMTYQVAVYKNTIDPENHHWESGEDLYRYVGDGLPAGSWKQIEVHAEDYQDRSGGEPESGAGITISGAYKPSTLLSPNGGENWRSGENRSIVWDSGEIEGETVTCYVLHDNPAAILDAIGRSDEAALRKSIASAHWYKFIQGALNSGNIGLDPSVMSGSGNAYMVLIVSSNGDWDISDSTFALNDSPDGGTSSGSSGPELNIESIEASNGTFPDKIVISWSAANEAMAYTLFRCINASEGSCTEIASLASTSYEDRSVLAKSKYYYRVEATDGSTKGPLSGYAVGWLSDDASLPVPARPNASKGIYLDKIVVSWSVIEAVQEGANYELYRCRSEDTSTCELISRTTGNIYEDKKENGLLPGRVYYYRLKVQGVGTESGEFSEYGEGFLDSDEPIAAPPSATMGEYGDGVKVAWPYVENATHYELYGCRSYGLRTDEIESNQECRLITYQSAYDADGNVYTEAFDSGAEPGVKYWYYVRARKGDSWGEFSRWSNAGYAGLTDPSIPNVSVTVINDVEPELSILPVPPGEHGAQYYVVYRCDSDNVDTCELLQTVRPYVSVLDNKIARGVEYYYRARSVSYNGNISDFSPYTIGKIK